MEDVAIVTNTKDLTRLEGIIQKNLQSFYEVGMALTEIRDKKLYSDVLGFETFEAYCKARWDFSRRNAYYLIDAAAVIENVNHGSQPPANERQARPLTRLEPEQQREAWKQVVETAPEGKITAAHVSKIVREMTIPKPPLQDVVEHGRSTVNHAFSDAMLIATFVISHLGRIKDHDPYRIEAITKIINWCGQQLEKESPEHTQNTGADYNSEENKLAAWELAEKRLGDLDKWMENNCRTDFVLPDPIKWGILTSLESINCYKLTILK